MLRFSPKSSHPNPRHGPEHNYYLFAATSLVIILALHAVSLKSKNGSVDRAFTTVVSLVLPIVILGIGLVFGAIVRGNGGSDSAFFESDILGVFTDRPKRLPRYQGILRKTDIALFWGDILGFCRFHLPDFAFVWSHPDQRDQVDCGRVRRSKILEEGGKPKLNEINQTHQILYSQGAKVRPDGERSRR